MNSVMATSISILTKQGIYPANMLELLQPITFQTTPSEQISPPAKRRCMQDDINHNDIMLLQDEYTTVFVSIGLLSGSRTDPLPIIPDNTISNPPNNPFDLCTSGDLCFSDTKAVNIQPEGTETSLRDYRFMQLEEQSVKKVPSFKSDSGFDSIGVPSQRGHRKDNKSTSQSGKKSYPCPLCNRSFQYSIDRNVHVVTQACTRVHLHIQHTVNGQWQCLTCDDDKIFNTKGSAERHARQHDKGNGMLCPVCNENFYGVKGNVLVQHVRKQHGVY